MINMREILDIVGAFIIVGGYHEYHGGCSVVWGTS